MERPSPDEPPRKIELGFDDPEFEALLNRRQQIEGEPFTPEGDEAEVFDVLLQMLPDTDPELAVAAFEAMATQGTSDLQETVAVRIDLLYNVHPEAAIRIWLHLIRSFDKSVSDLAIETLEMAIEEDHLSIEEMAPLVNAYLEVRERRTLEP